jgi:hypothetical protein
MRQATCLKVSSKLFVIASGEANVYGSSYYWNFRTSSFKQVACLILSFYYIRVAYHLYFFCVSKLSIDLFFKLPVNRYLTINIEGKIGQPTVIRFKQVACLILSFYYIRVAYHFSFLYCNFSRVCLRSVSYARCYQYTNWEWALYQFISSKYRLAGNVARQH